jgi:hypothetical protein
MARMLGSVQYRDEHHQQHQQLHRLCRISTSQDERDDLRMRLVALQVSEFDLEPHLGGSSSEKKAPLRRGGCTAGRLSVGGVYEGRR